MRHTRRWLPLLVVLAMLGALITACGGDDDSDDATATSATGNATATTTSAGSDATAEGTMGIAPLTPVTVGYVPVLIFAPVMLAADKGYFAEYGLDVSLEPLPGGSDMVVLTANGDFDLGVGGAGPAYFNAVARGINLTIIGPAHHEQTPPATPLVVSKKRFDSGELTEVADLAGKKVSVNARGATEYWLEIALETADLTIADVDLQTLPFGDVAAALESGALDGAMLGEPLATRAEQEGLIVRLEADSPSGFQPTFVWVNPGFAADSPDLVTGFMAGMLRGCRDLLSDDWDSDENLAILETYTGVPAALSREAARSYCDPNGEVNLADLETLQTFFAERGLLEYDEMLDVSTLVDSSFAKEAVEEIGVAE